MLCIPHCSWQSFIGMIMVINQWIEWGTVSSHFQKTQRCWSFVCLCSPKNRMIWLLKYQPIPNKKPKFILFAEVGTPLPPSRVDLGRTITPICCMFCMLVTYTLEKQTILYILMCFDSATLRQVDSHR